MKDIDYYENEENKSTECSEADSNEGSMLRKAALYIVLASAVIASVFGILHILLPKAVTAQAEPKKVSEPTAVLSPELTESPEEKKRCVLLDAGHGGFDPGTEGTQTGIPESKINLAIAKKVQSGLEEKGYIVLMTRTDDNAIAAGKKDDMSARVAIISRSNADVFVSIHQNALDATSVCGCEVYYHDTMPRSRFLAVCVEKRLSAIEDASPSRGVKTYDHMLTSHLQYSILIECGFLTNPEDEARLTSDEYQDRLAAAIVAGIEDFFAGYFEK